VINRYIKDAKVINLTPLGAILLVAFAVNHRRLMSCSPLRELTAVAGLNLSGGCYVDLQYRGSPGG
jgi:hypothetical protein